MCDFGLALKQNQERICGTPAYMAPEAFEGKEEPKSDVWSLGITLIEMATGENPFADCNSEEEMKNRVWNSIPPRLPTERWSFCFEDFVKKCLLKNVKRRSSTASIMNVGSI